MNAFVRVHLCNERRAVTSGARLAPASWEGFMKGQNQAGFLVWAWFARND